MLEHPTAPHQSVVLVRTLAEPYIQIAPRIPQAAAPHQLPAQSLQDQERVRVEFTQTRLQVLLHFRELVVLRLEEGPLEPGVWTGRVIPPFHEVFAGDETLLGFFQLAGTSQCSG